MTFSIGVTPLRKAPSFFLRSAGGMGGGSESRQRHPGGKEGEAEGWNQELHVVNILIGFYTARQNNKGMI